MNEWVCKCVSGWMNDHEWIYGWVNKPTNQWVTAVAFYRPLAQRRSSSLSKNSTKMINVTCWTWHKLERRADEWCKLLSFLVPPVAAVLLSNSEPWMNQGLRSVRPQTAKGGLWGSDEKWHWNMITSKWGVSLHGIHSWLTMAEVNDFVIVECI